MDEINTSLDKIVAEYNDSLTHSAPKKLIFDAVNDSLNDSDPVLKRRRLSSKFKNTSGNGGLNISDNSSNTLRVGLSPWEERNLRADLIEAKALISNLELMVEKEKKLRHEIETMSESKFKALIDQCSYTSNKLHEQDAHMKQLRQREHAAKQDKLKAIADLDQFKINSEESIRKLENEKMRIEQEARAIQNSMADEISDYKRKLDKFIMELGLSNDELDCIRGRMEEYKTKALAYDDLKAAFEKENQNWEFAKSRIKELEAEIASYNDWKDITKNSQARLQSIPDMQKELSRLKTANKHLHDVIGNKLLLEEQVHNYKTRLAVEEGSHAEVKALQVKLTYTEQELKEWQKIAQDHCLPNTLVSPMALRSRIEQLIQHDIIMTAEKKSHRSDAKSMQGTVCDLQQRCEIYLKNIDELNIVLKKHKNFKERLQRKLVMVSKERDFYKNLMDNFDKDLTMSNASYADMQLDAQIRYRIEVLERTVTGYKEMCATLEKEVTNLRQQETIIEPVSEGYDNVKKELDTLRLENEKLRRRKGELELELEHRCLKGDFNFEDFKVVHISDNPAAEAYANSKNFIEKLQAEIERLRRRNKKLEDDNEETQAKLNETSNMTMNFKEINQLRAELESTNLKMKKLKEYYKVTTTEFRDVCYMMLGYRIDRSGPSNNGIFRLSSMFAESPDDYLTFRLNENGCLELLETEYSIKIQAMIDTLLAVHKSIPAFLCQLTLDLFNKATVTIS